MTLLTATEATKRLCPIARISARPSVKDDVVPANCCGPECVLWRWHPLMANDPRVLSAVTREMALLKVERPKAIPANLHGEAMKRVMANPEGFTYPDPDEDKGWCGLGGRPE
jgi:hypothetical protein